MIVIDREFQSNSQFMFLQLKIIVNPISQDKEKEEKVYIERQRTTQFGGGEEQSFAAKGQWRLTWPKTERELNLG